MAQLLMEAGADKELRDNQGFTALDCAVSPELIQLLLEAGASSPETAPDP